MSGGEEQDLLDFYPDLSDEEEEPQQKEEELLGSQPHKLIKPNENQPQKSAPVVFTAPRLFGGRAFIPPPPPPGAKKYTPAPPPSMQPQKPALHPQNTQRPGNQDYPGGRQQRKNCVFVKNIPKHYCEVEKLMTFFRNEGQVKEIKVRQDDNSAIVRFIKEEHAVKFVNSNKAIFNRSFITYSLSDKDTVPPELLRQRQNEQAGKFKRPVEIQMRQLKERIDSILADKIRALLFLVKQAPEEELKKQFRHQLTECIEQKNNVAKWSFEEINEASKIITNEYDWTLGYTISSGEELDKKVYTAQMHKKYGPVESLETTPITSPSQQEIKEEQPSKSEYIVKVSFVSPRHAWQFFYLKQVLSKEAGINPEEKDMQVEGSSLKCLFNEGIIKAPQVILDPTDLPQPEKQDGLVQIDQLGEIHPAAAQPQPQPQVASQPQVSNTVQLE